MAISYDPKGFYYAPTQEINQAQRETNGLYIRNTLVTDTWAFLCPGHEKEKVTPWSNSAILAFLASCQYESKLNPDLYEGYQVGERNGYGLVQWTPGTLMRNFAATIDQNSYDIDAQLARIQYEIDHDVHGDPEDEWLPRGAYTNFDSFYEWTINTTSGIRGMIGAFTTNYLRPAVIDDARLNECVRYANAWETFFSTHPPAKPWRPPGFYGNKWIYYIRRR